MYKKTQKASIKLKKTHSLFRVLGFRKCKRHIKEMFSFKMLVLYVAMFSSPLRYGLNLNGEIFFFRLIEDMNQNQVTICVLQFLHAFVVAGR